MNRVKRNNALESIKKKYADKFISEPKVFSHIHRGDRIFIGTGCGKPQHLVKALVKYISKNPKAFVDTEVIHVWTLGVAPYLNEKFKRNFRLNTFFIGESIRDVVNTGMADYTPVFLSEAPHLFRSGLVPIDVALIQSSYPNRFGYMSLGISVDIVRSAVKRATLVIAQANSSMPWIHGDGIIHIKDIDYILPHDEPLLEFTGHTGDDETHQKIGKYVASIVNSGDTIQVGYGSLCDQILSKLAQKENLGVHTELLSDGVVDLMKRGAVDNTKKNIDRGRAVATFCMGKRRTYEYLHNNPKIEFRTADYTNNPLVIARIKNMTAINSALEVDLTGQATAESLGTTFFSGIGGIVDFMRGAALAPGGKSILALSSTTDHDRTSRIVPMIKEGAGVTLNRGDVHYVVTEYGIAYLHGKNIRERAMSLISIAHPSFRPWLIEEAKKLHLIYQDQRFIPGVSGEYPEAFEISRTTRKGINLRLRPVKLDDEPLLKDFFYSLSDKSLYRRFISSRYDMPHEDLQRFVVIDYKVEMVILAVIKDEMREIVVGVGEYHTNVDSLTAEVAFAVRDDYQRQGIGREILAHLAYIAIKQGLIGFTAEVLESNLPALHVIDSLGIDVRKQYVNGVYEVRIDFLSQRWGQVIDNF